MARVCVTALIGFSFSLLLIGPTPADDQLPRRPVELAQGKPGPAQGAAGATPKADKPRDPATVDEAAKVLDLRTFPMMEGANPQSRRRLSGLMYVAESAVKPAFAFQQKHLIEAGWKELPGTQLEDTYATAFFGKEGFVAYVSISPQNADPNKPPMAQVMIGNYGNVALDKLPVPKGVTPFYSFPSGTSYLTEAKIPETAEALRKLLVADGWTPYGTASNDPNSPSMYFKKNAVRIMAWVSSAPAQGGKTVIQLSSELLSADLPMPPSAPDPRYDDDDKTVRFDWPGEDGSEVIAFYQAELPKKGWTATTERPVTDDKKGQQFLIFRNSGKDMISLDLQRYTDIVRVLVRHRTAAEVEEMDRQFAEEQEQARQKLAAAKKKPAGDDDSPKTAAKGSKKASLKDIPGLPEGIELPDLGDDVPGDVQDLVKKALEDAGVPAKQKKGKGAKPAPATTTEGAVKVAEIPIPQDATDVDYKKTVKMIEVKTPSDVKSLADFFVEGLTEKGWSKVNNGLVDEKSAILKLSNGAAELSIFIHGKDDGSEATLMTKNLSWESVPQSKKSAKRATARAKKKAAEVTDDTDPPITADPPKKAAARAIAGRPVTVAEQKQTGTKITIDDKVYKMEYGVAFESKQSDRPTTEVLLTEKPIAVERIIAALKLDKEPDVAGFQRHLKLRFDDAGKLTYLFMYADGLSINRGGSTSDFIDSEIALADGRARGKATMKEPEKFFDQRYRIESTFDVKLATGPVDPNAPPPTDDVPADGLIADEEDGLPFPDSKTSRFSTTTPYRKLVTVVVPSTTEAVGRFYQRELTKRGWKENAAATKIAADQGTMSFAGLAGNLSVKLTRKEADVTAVLATRNTAKAQADGILPQANKGRLILGNASNQNVTLTINGQQYKLAAMRGAKDPKDGTTLHVLPGRYTVSIQIPGQAEQKEDLNIAVDETWGVIVIPTGGLLADQLY